MKTFEALADPTRRQIVELLADGEKSAGELGERFSVSQPAVSRHLRVLREAELVVSRAAAQRRMYRLNPKPLAEIDAWLERYRRFWSDRLTRLTDHLVTPEPGPPEARARPTPPRPSLRTTRSRIAQSSRSYRWRHIRPASRN